MSRPARHAVGAFTRVDPATGVRRVLQPLRGRATSARFWPGISRQLRAWYRASDVEAYRARVMARVEEGLDTEGGEGASLRRTEDTRAPQETQTMSQP